jgi:hypothetical protein
MQHFSSNGCRQQQHALQGWGGCVSSRAIQPSSSKELRSGLGAAKVGRKVAFRRGSKCKQDTYCNIEDAASHKAVEQFWSLQQRNHGFKGWGSGHAWQKAHIAASVLWAALA